MSTAAGMRFRGSVDGARSVRFSANIVALMALLLPPALLLQRQAWVVPRTGLGTGIGLVLGAAIVLVAILLMAANMHPAVAHTGPVPPLLLAWTLALTWSLFAWSTGGLHQLQLYALVGFTQSVAEVLLVLALMGALAAPTRYMTFVRVLIVCGGLYGLFLVAASLIGEDIAPLFRLPFLEPVGELADIESARGGFIRPQGMAGHPLEAAAVATVLAPLAIGLARASRGPARFWVWGCAALLILGSLSTLSRSATVGLVVALAFMALRWPIRTIFNSLIGAAIAAMVLVLAASDRVITYLRLFSLDANTDSGLLSREVARDQAFRTISEHFWTGRGVSSHALLGGRTLDNQYLSLAAEQGVPAMIVYTLLLAVPTWVLLHRCTRLPRWERDVAIGLAGSLVAVLVCSLILDVFGFPQVRFLVFILLALVGPLLLAARRHDAPRSRARTVPG